MNERIQELAIEATTYAIAFARREDPMMLDAAFVEKFAQLIVRECVISAEREWIRNGDTEHNRAVSKVIESIKQQFGVE